MNNKIPEAFTAVHPDHATANPYDQQASDDVDLSTEIKKKKRLLVLSVESTWSPCPQIRLIRPFSHLHEDWEVTWGVRDGKIALDNLENIDLILLHRFTPGLIPINILQEIFSLGKPVIYESDDLLNDMPADHPEAATGVQWKEGIEYALRHATAVVASTEFLAEQYRQFNTHIHVLKNYLDVDIFYRPVPQKKKNDPIRIGILGSSIQPSNFVLIDRVLQRLCQQYGERLSIHLVGWICPPGWDAHPNAKFITFIHEYEGYAKQLKEMAWDIALVPLAKDDFNQCKSPVKWFDYSAAGIASIFSDVSVYNQVVTHGKTGMLLPNDEAAWLEAITQLIEFPQKRQALAVAAQQEVQANYNLENHAAHYNQVYSTFIDNAAVTTVQQADSPVSSEHVERIPGIMITDPAARTEALKTTLQSLGAFLSPAIKIIILTTGKPFTHKFGDSVQFLTTTSNAYAQMLSQVSHHKAMNWLLKGQAGQVYSPSDIPDLASYQAPNAIFSQEQTDQASTPSESDIYLHLGSGTKRFDGFINIDLDSPHADMHLDLTKPLPWQQNTVSGIYSEHFIEHISQAEGIHLMMECRRVLKPGGIVRIATPDLASIAKEYVSGKPHPDWAELGMKWTANQCERMNIAMRWWGHQWVYDEQELTRIGKMAGLELVGRYQIGESDLEIFKDREYRPSSELILEFIKPNRQPDMANPPLVSVLIPSYNPRFFAQALESAINQTYRNIEIVISDDCAGPEIENIVRPYAQKDQRIRYMKHTSELARKDYGRSNVHDSFIEAKGEFIKFLFDDDLLAPDCVMRMVKAFSENSDISLVTSKRQRIDGDGNFLPDIGATVSPVTNDAVIDGLILGRALLSSRLNFVGEPSTAMFRKKDMEDTTPDVMSFDNHEVGGIGDVAIWMNLATKGNAVYLVDSLSYFRSHEGQVQVTLRDMAEKAAKEGWDIMHASWQRRGFLN